MSGRALRILAVVFALSVLGLGAAGASSDPAPDESPKKRPWKPEDVVMVESAGDFRISPNGKWVLWTKSTPDKEKDAIVSNLYLSSLTEKKEVQLTRGSYTVSHPRWSPSGETIAFLSTRLGPKATPTTAKQQIWLENFSGGEPWCITNFDRDVKQIEWLGNDAILFIAEEDPSLYERENKERKDDSRVIDDAAHAAPVRLFKLSVKDEKVTRLTDNTDWIDFFEVSRDGKWAAAVAQRELSFEWDQKTPPATYLVNLSSGERTQLFAGQRIEPEGIAWTRDNSGFYVVSPYSSDARFVVAAVRKVYYYDTGSSGLTEVNLDWDRALAGRNVFVTEDGFVALLADGAHSRLARYTRHGAAWSRKSITGENVQNIFDISLGDDSKTLVYEYSTASIPAQWYHARLDGAKISGPVQFTELNPQYKGLTMAKTEVVHWKGANNDDVEGILYYPLNYQPGKRYPLVAATHGGPAFADHDQWSESWAYPNNLLTERGAFVLKTNYHGSSDYGLEWVQSICCGKYYTLEIPDIEKGIDNQIARGLVDPGKIGAMGWSNGSILSIELTVTDPERFKAAAVGAGDVEWLSDWANVDFGESFDSYYFGKSPIQDPQLYLEKSPLLKLDRVTTPTLIFFGTNDRQVPTEQGWTHYRTLYNLGKAPVKFILFPDEAHGPKKLSHQLRKVTEEMTWFDEYLFQTKSPENEALKKGSPLDTALRRRMVQKSGGNYGIAFEAPSGGDQPAATILIPEAVKRGAIEVGRFEVTRDQFSAFDKDYKFDAGTEDFPANAITFEQAQAYCEWLSKLTGDVYRLPSESEAAELYKARGGENTLDYWAGYAPNPDDAARLAEKLKELGEGAPLLKEVGSFPGAGEDGEELIFDTDGNVAEWVASGTSGKTFGGSADRPSDPKSRSGPADISYTGFRVVHIPAVKPASAPNAPGAANAPGLSTTHDSH
jgi:dipeptidyl aminopeptidase/acylaminoacyl peptidase